MSGVPPFTPLRCVNGRSPRGIEVTGGALDAYVAPLDRHNVSWRARAGAAGEGGWSTQIGSIWTGGAGGQAVELHGR